MREVILVPIKSFDVGKSRLRESMTDGAVADLMRTLARGVIEACAPTPCWVLCDDDDVSQFAQGLGATALTVAGDGLNAAVAEGYRAAGDAHERVVIAHADLITPGPFTSAAFGPGITIATDRHGTGTNVLALPTGLDFTFFYGVGSARAHADEAERLGMSVTVLSHSPWATDLDEPADLALLPKT